MTRDDWDGSGRLGRLRITGITKNNFRDDWDDWMIGDDWDDYGGLA